MVCKERGSAWGWASKIVLLKRSFSVAVACCCQVSGLGHWLGSDLEGNYAALKTSTPKHVKRGEKFKMFPDMLLLHLLFLLERNYGEYLCENCSMLLVTICSELIFCPLQFFLLCAEVDRKSSTEKKKADLYSKDAIVVIFSYFYYQN